MRRSLRLLGAVVLLTLILFGMVGLRQFTLMTGSSVLLETKPVDPGALFRGDFVRLNYQISELSLGAVTGDNAFKSGDAVFVQLSRGKLFALPVSLHKKYPAVLEDHVVVKGRVVKRHRGAGTISVRYGIEDFSVPQGEGLARGRPKPDSKVTILVAVDRFGNAAVKDVLVNGQTRYSETLF